MQKIEHIGIAVTDIDASNKVFEKVFGKENYKSEKVESEGVVTSFFQIGENKIELVDFLKIKGSKLEGFRGCITIQCFMHKKTEDVIGIEINPRFGGGFPVSYLAGANFPKWIIEEYLFNKQLDYFDDWEENLLIFFPN